MLIVQSFCPKDQQAAQRSAEWLRELGGAKGHSLLLVEDTRVTNAVAVQAACRESFDNVEVLPFTDHYDKWPESPNDAFQTAARHIGEKYPQPFLWYEPDSVVLVPGAFDALWKEYQEAGKLFMGMFVKGIQDSPDHISGVSIYPGDLVQHAGLALIAGEIPFDIAAASQIMPLAQFTKLIAHYWKGLGFSSLKELRELIGPEPVLYHSDKSSKTIELLRAEKNLPAVPVLADPNTSRTLLSEAGVGEAQESTENCDHTGEGSSMVDSCDGGQNLSTNNRGAAGPIMVPQMAIPIIPWANKEESLDYIDSLALELKKFCTAPRSTLVVRERLRKIKVITKVR